MAVYHEDHLLARWDPQGLVHWNVDMVGSLFLRNEVEPKKSTGIWTTLSKKKRKSWSWQNKKIIKSSWCLLLFSHSDIWLFMTPMDGSPPGSSVYGIFQARLLEWIVISSSRGSCRPRGKTCISWVSCIDRQILYHCSSWEPLLTTWIEMIYFLKNLILVFALLSPPPPPHLSILNT